MSRTLALRRFASVISRAVLPGIIVGALYLGATSTLHAASGDGPVAGAIVDEFDVLYGLTSDVIVTTACLQGNPFVPSQPPSILAGTPTLSGCKLDVPGGTAALADTAQLITVLPNNFKGADVLTSVNTFGTGSNTAIEFGVKVDALSKDIFMGLANPGLFASSPFFDSSSDVSSTADAYCTSINGSFVCVKVEPGAGQTTSCPSGASPLLVVQPDSSFCSDLTGILGSAYNLERNPLAYAISTNMSKLAQAGSVTLRLCNGFKAQCLPPNASPIASNIQVTTVHTQGAFVETPRTRLPYY